MVISALRHHTERLGNTGARRTRRRNSRVSFRFFFSLFVSCTVLNRTIIIIIYVKTKTARKRREFVGRIFLNFFFSPVLVSTTTPIEGQLHIITHCYFSLSPAAADAVMYRFYFKQLFVRSRSPAKGSFAFYFFL